MKWNFLFVFFFSFHFARGQSPVISYAHYVIDTLTSSFMDGRGYVDSSDWKAATFIQHEFAGMKLKPLAPDYFQTLTFSANTFPGAMSVKYNGKQLIPGQDYLVEAGSSSISGKFKVIRITKQNGLSDTAMSEVPKALAVAKKYEGKKVFLSYNKKDWTKPQYQLLKTIMNSTNAFYTKGVIEFGTGKLTWDASTEEIPYCSLQLKDSVLKKNSKIEVNIESQFKKSYASQNVTGFFSGTTDPDSFIVFTSHYDHLGQMGDGTYFPGANDNASGTSMVLNLAKYFSEHPSKYSVAFICFTGEELGLLGSSYFVQHPLFPLDKIKFLVNLDIVGTGDEGIKVVDATEFPKQFDQLVKLNDEYQYMKVVSPRGKAANSDHYPFYVNGVPCFFIYTMGGISAYHDIYDRAQTLPLTDYDDLFKLLIDFENGF